MTSSAVLMPAGFIAGSQILHHTPDGRILSLTIPAGVTPGSILNLEHDNDSGEWTCSVRESTEPNLPIGPPDRQNSLEDAGERTWRRRRTTVLDAEITDPDILQNFCSSEEVEEPGVISPMRTLPIGAPRRQVLYDAVGERSWRRRGTTVLDAEIENTNILQNFCSSKEHDEAAVMDVVDQLDSRSTSSQQNLPGSRDKGMVDASEESTLSPITLSMQAWLENHALKTTSCEDLPVEDIDEGDRLSKSWEVRRPVTASGVSSRSVPDASVSAHLGDALRNFRIRCQSGFFSQDSSWEPGQYLSRAANLVNLQDPIINQDQLREVIDQIASIVDGEELRSVGDLFGLSGVLGLTSDSCSSHSASRKSLTSDAESESNHSDSGNPLARHDQTKGRSAQVEKGLPSLLVQPRTRANMQKPQCKVRSLSFDDEVVSVWV